MTLGQPLEAASMLNRLQAQSKLPLLVAADFEGGVGFRVAGATLFPKAMAFGATGDERLAYTAANVAAREARAIGVHLHFAPVADVNNNPRNPVINTRSYGADPARVGAFASAWVRGLAAGGALATLKHFPGSRRHRHRHAPRACHRRASAPAPRRGRARAVPRRHRRQGRRRDDRAPRALGRGRQRHARTLSKPVVDGLLRQDLGFDGLAVTDSMGMAAVTTKASAGEAAVLAFEAGNDLVLNPPDEAAAFNGLRRAVESGRISAARLDASVTRILRAKARTRPPPVAPRRLNDLPKQVGTRSAAKLADDISARASRWSRTIASSVPLRLPREASVLFLSIVDYPAGWRIASPSRAFQPELRQRWPNTTAIELSDRATREEIELVRAMAPRYDAIVAAVYVRASSASGRSNLPDPLADLLTQLAASTKALEQAVRRGVHRQPLRRGRRARRAGDPAHLRSLRSRRAVRGPRDCRRREDRRTPAGAAARPRRSRRRARSMSDEIEAPAARCANCGAVLHGRFCAACGQAVKPLDPPVRYFAKRVRAGAVRRRRPRAALVPAAVLLAGVPDARVCRGPPRAVALAAQAVSADQRRDVRVLAVAGDRTARLEVHGDSREVDARVQSFGFASEAEMRAPLPPRATPGCRASCSCSCRSSPGWSRSFGAAPAATFRRTSCSRSMSMPPRSACAPLTTAIGLSLPAPPRAWLDSARRRLHDRLLFLALRPAYGGTRGRAVRDTVVVGRALLVRRDDRARGRSSSPPSSAAAGWPAGGF